MGKPDITIRGAGIFGLTIAWECHKLGAQVAVIDPGGPGAGASGGVLGALAPHVPENWNAKKAFQFDSLIRARSLWPEIEQASGLPTGYGATGRLQPLADARAVELAQARSALARTLWKGQATWQVTDAPAHPDWRPPSPTGQWVFDSLSARINPRAACAALARALVENGVSITAEGPDHGAVIDATGTAGLLALNARFGRQIGAGIKGQAALLRLPTPQDAPQVFADALHIIAHDNGTVAIGSTTERDFADPTATDAALEALIDTARRFMPALRAAPVVERWAGLRPRARSRAPLMGRDPGHAGRYIANGGFKIGVGMAPKVAVEMARLVVEGRADIPAEFDSEIQLAPG